MQTKLYFIAIPYRLMEVMETNQKAAYMQLSVVKVISATMGHFHPFQPQVTQVGSVSGFVVLYSLHLLSHS